MSTGVKLRHTSMVISQRTERHTLWGNFEVCVYCKYKIKVYLFLCWKLYSVLHTFIPISKNLFANKLFSFFAATMAWSGFGPYHGMWRDYAQTKCIGAILTPLVMTNALDLRVITPQPELYHTYGRVCLRNFYFMS